MAITALIPVEGSWDLEVVRALKVDYEEMLYSGLHLFSLGLVFMMLFLSVLSVLEWACCTVCSGGVLQYGINTLREKNGLAL